MKNWIGKAIIGIGVLHTVLGFVFFQPTLSEIWSERLFNTVHMQPMREACFWFLFGGIMMIFLGIFFQWAEQQNLFLPKTFGWLLFGLASVVVFIMPASGGWLLFAPALGLLLKNKPPDNDIRRFSKQY